jgi:hypothetical protein
MTILKIAQFSGMVPRLPAERLPDSAAAYALNCDFAHGELRSLKGPGPLQPTTQAVRSLFTDDGLRFFAWPTYTRAYLAPTVGDAHSRVYFNSEGQGLRVAQMTAAYPALANPRPPAQSWAVGVARPASAPEVELKPSNSWAGDAGATLRMRAVCLLAGVEAKSVEATVVSVESPWQQVTVEIPTAPCGAVTPEDGTTSGLQPGPDGWIYPPHNGVAHWDRRVVVVPAAGDGGGTVYEAATQLLRTGRWRIKSGMSTVEAITTALGAEYWAPVKHPDGGLFDPTAFDYLGRIYDGAAALYTGLTSGAGNVTTGAAQLMTEGTMAFVAEVVGSSGVTLATGSASNFSREVGTNRYSVTIDWGTAAVESIAYVTTFENTWGEESAPSDPVTVEVMPFQDVLVKQAYTPLSGGRPVRGINLYRTYGRTADYIKVNTIPRTEMISGKWAVWDATDRPATAVTLQSQEWDPPPSNLHSLTYAGNGFFAGASGKDIRFSEPYRPHAWPYFMTLPYSITGIIEVEGGLLVTTTAQPYLVYGPHPEQMTQQALNAEQAGMTPRSMARIEGSAIYVSNDGLVQVSGGQATVGTQDLFTRNDWRDWYRYTLRDITLGAWDGQVLGIIDAPNGMNFMLRMDEAPGFSTLALPGRATGIAVSHTTDELFLCFEEGFAEFGAGEDLALMWHSKVFKYPRPVSFGAAVARYDGQFVLTVVDASSGRTAIEIQLPPGRQDEYAFRLHPVSPSKQWQVAVFGTGTFRAIELGASFMELRNG